MSSGENARSAKQEPRLRIEPKECAYTDGPDAADLMANYGFVLDPWQQLILNQWAARDADDKPTYTTCGLSAPRQNGKNGIIEAYEFYKMLVDGEKILHTAHLVKTANKSFQRLAALFTTNAPDEIKGCVEKVRYTNGEQGIYLKNGGFVEYSARSRGASRGNTYSVIIVDEAQEYNDEQQEAMMSTIAASPTGYRQIIYTGTPPGPTCAGTVFKRTRQSAIDGKSKNMCWHEWSVEAMPDMGDVEKVLDAAYETNPALGIRLDEDFTMEEFAQMSADGFARERLGFWVSMVAVSAAIDPNLWESTAVESISGIKERKTAFGLKFSPDGSVYALAGAVMDRSGHIGAELIECGNTGCGTKSLAKELASRSGKCSCVLVDGQNEADTLCSNLNDEKPPKNYVIRARTSDVIAAAGMLIDFMKDGSFTHASNDGQIALDESARNASRRQIGRSGWGFGGESTAIEALALAVYAVKVSKRNPRRKQAIL